MTTLVTFGCSWTWGKGCFYPASGMTKEEYHKRLADKTVKKVDPEKYSFRSILSRKYNLKNINFSKGGSSNATQFRLAEEFFNTKHDDDMIVMWGITSTARGMVWANNIKSVNAKTGKTVTYNGWTDIMYSCKREEWEIATQLATKYYEHQAEVELLQQKMYHWNQFFEMKGIKNIWFDTLNHHYYQNPPENMCWRTDPKRDLLSKLCIQNGMNPSQDNRYHLSHHRNDCQRIDYLKRKCVVNPFSYHPTLEAHEDLAIMLDDHVKNLLQ